MNNALKIMIALLISFLLAACGKKDEVDPSCYTPEGCSPEAEDTAGSDTGGDSGDGGKDTGDGGTDTGEDTGGDTGTDTGDGGTDTGDGGGDTGDGGDISEEINCWYDTPFQIRHLEVDRTLAELVPGNWDRLDWVDYDPIHILDASTNNVEVEINTLCGTTAREGTMFIPDDFVMTDTRDELYNNGVVAALQPNGTVLEANYFEDCGDGSYAGYLLPDSSPFNACGVGYDTSRYTGAHGGSHITGTQAIQPDELTNDVEIARPLPVEVDFRHLYCDPLETDGLQCFTGPLASSGDREGDEIYAGEIEGLTMGGILVLPESFDCEGEMRTTPGMKLCQVARDHFYFIVDDSYGEHEVAFPMEASVPNEVQAEFGIELHNATGDFASDVEEIFVNILVVQNPEEAVY